MGIIRNIDNSQYILCKISKWFIFEVGPEMPFTSLQTGGGLSTPLTRLNAIPALGKIFDFKRDSLFH